MTNASGTSATSNPIGPVRGAAKAAVDNGHMAALTGFRTAAVEQAANGQLALVAEDGTRA